MIGNLHIVPLLSLLSGLANAALAAFVIGKDFHSPVNRWLAGLAVSFSFWGIGEFFMRTAADPVSAMFWVKFEALGYVAVGSLYLLFAYHYSKQGDRLRNNWMRVLLWAPPMVFLGLIWFAEGFVYTGIEAYHSWGNRPAIGPGFHPLVAYIAIEWVAGAVVFARRVRSLETSTQRIAAGYIFAGTILPIVVAAITAGLFPIFGVDLPEMATHVSIINAAILVLIIQRFRVLTFVPSRFADTLVASTDDAIIATDPEGAIVYFSPGAERMFGLPAEQLLGAGLATLFEDGQAEWENMRGLLSQQDSLRNYQITIADRLGDGSGRERTASLSLSALYDEQGTQAGLVAVARDVTDLMQLQDQLMRSQRMESLGSLVGGIAHDFNNILSVILPRSEILQHKRPDDDVVMEHTAQIQRAVSSATDLVRRLLAFARGTRHSTAILDPNAVIAETLDMLARTLPGNVRLVRDLQDDLPLVEADHLQFEQALVNLVLNGVDAMPEGGKITVACRRFISDRESVLRRVVIPAGDWIMVSVRDTGVGIPVDRLDRIFDPFFTTKPVGKGTGLGLAIVETFIKAAHGYVEVYSQPGISTTFELILPATEKTIRSPMTQAEPAESKPGKRILVVDPLEDIRELIRHVLADAGHSVTIFESLPRLVAQLAQSRADRSAPSPDLLLLATDSLDPDHGVGLESIRKVAPNAAVVLTSTRGGDPEPGAGGGVSVVLQKPFQVDELLQAIRTALGRSRSNQVESPGEA